MRIELRIYIRGTREWATKKKSKSFDNFSLHNKYGPAKIWSDGDTDWYKDGELHRLDGPAIEWSNGGGIWYINGVAYDSYLEYLVAVNQIHI